jgi:hypothetical protein
MNRLSCESRQEDQPQEAIYTLVGFKLKTRMSTQSLWLPPTEPIPWVKVSRNILNEGPLKYLTVQSSWGNDGMCGAALLQILPSIPQ